MKGPAGIRCPPLDYSTGTGRWGQIGQMAPGPIKAGWKTDAPKKGVTVKWVDAPKDI